jgi:hypothetical protein
MNRMVAPSEFTLAKRLNGRHFEEFCSWDDPQALMDIHKRAKLGTLDGHMPVSGEKYAARVYPYEKKILVKLTRRRLRHIRR